jgi:hypothetical protein
MGFKIRLSERLGPVRFGLSASRGGLRQSAGVKLGRHVYLGESGRVGGKRGRCRG